ncbi:hypothetical protein ACFHW2_30215 [Actinomadura sp. LOL_016]|uniref:hypothetical protein n=1 Tax=unclassified Actinomadura TaxID=2626254 RepID=UPI003A811D39
MDIQAGRGEWFCAQEQARLLADQGRRAEALEVLAPYVATGWWKAVETVAGMLEEWGRGDEAIVLARRHAEVGERSELVAGPRPGRRRRGGGTGRGRRRAADRCIDAPRSCDDPSCSRRRIEPFNAVDLVAAIRERQGRVDEALVLLHTRETTSVNGRDQLADLLARHDRIEELRAYAAAESLGTAAQCLAEVLEARGDVEGAIAVYRQPGSSQFRRRGARSIPVCPAAARPELLAGAPTRGRAARFWGPVEQPISAAPPVGPRVGP